MSNENVGTIEDLKGSIDTSIQVLNEGKPLAQQSLENYITEVLNMEIIKSEDVGNKREHREIYDFVVKSKKEGFNSKYLFTGKYYSSNFFTSREYSLILTKIIGEEGSHKIDELFYLTESREDSNRNHRLLITPLSKLLSGEVEDPEIKFLVKCLKKTFEGKFGYEYNEKNRGNPASFVIIFNDEITMQTGFSNTVQIDFKKKSFQSVQIMFRDVSEESVEKKINQLYLLLEKYFDWNITINDKHSMSDLYDFLGSKNYVNEVFTNVLMVEKLNGITKLFHNFVIGNYSSHNQIDVSIGYKTDTDELELSMNHLFKRTNTLCKNVDEVKTKIEKMESWIKENGNV